MRKKGKKSSRIQFQHLLIKEYYDDITFNCPKRGIVTQRVLIRKYKSRVDPDGSTFSRKNDEIKEFLDDNENYYTEDDSNE